MANTIVTIETHLEIDEGTIQNVQGAGYAAAEKIQKVLDDSYKEKGQIKTKFIAVRFSKKLLPNE